MDYKCSILFVLLTLVLAACTQVQEVTCNKPYIKVGTSCCLDVNDNSICDQDEPKSEAANDTVEVQPEKVAGSEAVIEEANVSKAEQNAEAPKKKTIADVQNAVVTIEGWSPYAYENKDRETVILEGEFSGSGFIADADGDVITNAHVVVDYINYCTKSTRYSSACRLEARTLDGSTYKLEWLSLSFEWDLAVLRMKNPERNFEYLEFAPDSGKVGDTIYVLGTPEGYEFSVTKGIISQKDRDSLDLPDDKRYSKYLQTDAAVNPGNSGGPIVNEDGEVVGVASFGYLLQEGLNFGLQSEIVQRVFDKTFNDTQVVLRKTKTLIEPSSDSYTKQVALNHETVKLLTNGNTVRFEGVKVNVGNKGNATINVCFDFRLISLLGITNYARNNIVSKEIKPGSVDDVELDFVVEFESDLLHFYLLDAYECSTGRAYGRVYGPGILNVR